MTKKWNLRSAHQKDIELQREQQNICQRKSSIIVTTELEYISNTNSTIYINNLRMETPNELIYRIKQEAAKKHERFVLLKKYIYLLT